MKKFTRYIEQTEENHKKYCRRCHRELKNPKCKEIGYGPSCYKKILAERISNPLFEVKKT